MTASHPSLHSSLHPSEHDFSVGVRWSFFLHLTLVVFILVKSLAFPEAPVHYFPSLQVDLVDLPDVLKNDMGKAPPSSDLTEALKQADQEVKKPAELQNKKDEMALKPKPDDTRAMREKRLKSALARIKSLARINADAEGETPRIVKGNKISRGTSLSGDARESAVTSYYDILRDHLQAGWALSVWLNRQDLSAQVQVFVDDRGSLRYFKFLKISGNAQFDAAVKRTLTERQPYPIPPSSIARSILSDGIVVGFPL